MAIAALVTWLITAGFGFFMLIRWATSGGLREVPGAGTNFPRVRVFAHFGLAAAGLIVWIIYLVTGNTLWAWIAVADLILVATPGRAAGEAMDKRRPCRHGERHTVGRDRVGRRPVRRGCLAVSCRRGRSRRAAHPTPAGRTARGLRRQHSCASAVQRTRPRPKLICRHTR